MEALQTNAPPSRPTLSSHLFKEFSDFIYTISGIRFQESKSYFLASKIQNRCDASGQPNFDAYLAFLKSPAAKTTEYGLLLDQITINETFFFRNQPQLESFERDFLQAMMVKRRAQGKRKIRIWSCASSTGDEAYTTALQILAMEGAKDFRFEIIGTDICNDAVQKAKKGEYKRYAIRNIPPDMLQRYFDVAADQQTYILKDAVKNMVQFQTSSLLDETRVRMLGKFDFAFCRNVLIYFDDASKEKALTNISNALEDDGVLIAGHSENLYSYRHLFRINKDHNQTHAYEKAPAGTEKSRF